MTSYRSIFSAILLASSLAGFAAPVVAAPYECGVKGDRGNYFEHRGERMERHHKRLLEALKLSPEQEVAWKKFVASDGTMRMDRGAMKSDDWAKLTSPERAERMLELLKERQTRMGEHVAALKEFYAVLTPEQKATFDKFHSGPRQGMHGKRDRRNYNPERSAPK
ncbi:MAG: Spy/CpxP family protein refolding chaperone [Azonexaceae bacterium]|nr:Spy/CpxP family protein refolding chaperone [Azonexaceae bacterium]